jgi:hypothetical protein
VAVPKAGLFLLVQTAVSVPGAGLSACRDAVSATRRVCGLLRGKSPMQVGDHSQIPLAIAFQICSPIARRNSQAGLVLPYLAFKVRN